MIYPLLDSNEIKDLIYANVAQNYFICMAFETQLKAYQSIYVFTQSGMPDVVLFYRKSQNLQIAIRPNFKLEKNGVSELATFINKHPFKELIIAESVLQKLAGVFSEVAARDGAHIQVWTHRNSLMEKSRLKEKTHLGFEIKPLKKEHLIDVVQLYDRVFSGHASMAYMTEKLQSLRGRGVAIWQGSNLVSVAQTDFDDQIIVGVATDPLYQGMGYGKVCMLTLLEMISHTLSPIHLQVENPIAIDLYQKLGFVSVDKVLHVTKC